MDKNSKKTLLVVDDEAWIRELLVEILIDQGLAVVEAEEGRQALELFRAQHFDLVLSDVRMPGGDGLTLLSEIKACSPSTPVIMLTGTPEDINSAATAADGVLAKPFNSAELVKCIGEQLSTLEKKTS